MDLRPGDLQSKWSPEIRVKLQLHRFRPPLNEKRIVCMRGYVKPTIPCEWLCFQWYTHKGKPLGILKDIAMADESLLLWQCYELGLLLYSPLNFKYLTQCRGSGHIHHIKKWMDLVSAYPCRGYHSLSSMCQVLSLAYKVHYIWLPATPISNCSSFICAPQASLTLWLFLQHASGSLHLLFPLSRTKVPSICIILFFTFLKS